MLAGFRRWLLYSGGGGFQVAPAPLKIPATWTGDPVRRTNTQNKNENTYENTNTNTIEKTYENPKTNANTENLHHMDMDTGQGTRSGVQT